MINMIMKLFRNCHFTLMTGNSSKNRFNNMPQGSILAPLLFNIYTYELPDTISTKYANENDLAIMQSTRNWFLLEETLNHDLANTSNYLQKLKLKLSPNKKGSTCFHHSCKNQFHVQVNKKFLTFCAKPTYLGIILGRALNYR